MSITARITQQSTGLNAATIRHGIMGSMWAPLTFRFTAEFQLLFTSTTARARDKTSLPGRLKRQLTIMPKLILFDGRVMDRARHLVPPAGSPDFWRVTQSTDQLRSFIGSIREAAQRTRIQQLRLLCHGNSGRLQFTTSGVNCGNVNAFAGLRGFVTGSVQLHACGIASSQELVIFRTRGLNMGSDQATPGSLDHFGPNVSDSLRHSSELDTSTGRMIRTGQGVQFLMAFANAIGLPVTGAIHAQDPDPTWKFEGPTITAWPMGVLLLNIPQNDRTFGQVAPGDYGIPQ